MTVKKILAGTMLTVLVMVSGLVTIIFFPEPLFAHKLTHGQFNVYSNEVPESEIREILDNSLNRVMKSELYDPAYTYDVFLCNDSFFNKIDDTFLGKEQAARATDNNVIIKVDIDAKRNLAFPTFFQRCEANLTYLIAHEMMHCLQENRYGKVKFNPFRHPEYWKLEGYPEYISRQPQLSSEGYNLIWEIERYVDLEKKSTDFRIAVEEDGCKAPKYYYKSRLMMEYLIDIRKYSYDKILHDSTREYEIFAEMLRWKDEAKE